MGGAGARAGPGAGNAEKDTRTQAVEWGEVGKRAVSRIFQGPVCPVKNSMPDASGPLLLSITDE